MHLENNGERKKIESDKKMFVFICNWSFFVGQFRPLYVHSGQSLWSFSREAAGWREWSVLLNTGTGLACGCRLHMALSSLTCVGSLKSRPLVPLQVSVLEASASLKCQFNVDGNLRDHAISTYFLNQSLQVIQFNSLQFNFIGPRRKFKMVFTCNR